MKRVVLASIFAIVLVSAATLAWLHFGPSSSSLRALASPGALSPRHATLVAECESCHEPGVGVTPAKCTACHATAERLLGRQSTAFHASIDECAACHVEHQGVSVRPAVMDHAELARIGARTLARASATDPDSAATLRSLQVWLGGSAVERFDDDAARGSLDCAGCHDRRDPHLQRFGNDCAQCHATTAWKVPGYRHPASGSKDCVQCHRPPPSHLMGHFSMVSQRVARKEHARVDECYECHVATSWNDIAGVGFYKHH